MEIKNCSRWVNCKSANHGIRRRPSPQPPSLLPWSSSSSSSQLHNNKRRNTAKNFTRNSILVLLIASVSVRPTENSINNDMMMITGALAFSLSMPRPRTPWRSSPTASSATTAASAASASATTSTLNQRQQREGERESAAAAFSRAAGESALAQVQWMGSRVAENIEQAAFSNPEEEALRKRRERKQRKRGIVERPCERPIRSRVRSIEIRQGKTKMKKKEKKTKRSTTVDGTGGSVYDNQLDAYNAQKRSFLDQVASRVTSDGATSAKNEKQVWEALANLEQDMQLLDTLAGQRPQLSALEFTLLSAAVGLAAIGPLVLGGEITEFVAPSMAAFTAAIGIGAEYSGKVAVANGKEVAAASIVCAAEAEGFLAQAERAKAITPLCVGVGATAASLALLVPVLLDSLALTSNIQLGTEIYLVCPLVSILAAAVASLALQETQSFAQRAIGIGNRRFAKSGMVGRTWLSSTDTVERKSKSAATKWKRFSLAVLSAPILGALVPGTLTTKTIVVAALGAAESAYFLTLAESVLSRATDAVALKARSAAVSDTYANQGSRSAAILPFTSALSSLCAAATAAIVELPFLESLTTATTTTATAAAAGGGTAAWAAGAAGVLTQMVTVSIFPALSALFAAAASVSKARCLVDAEAASQAASTLALEYEREEDSPILIPLRGVRELVQLTISNSIREPFKRLFRRPRRPNGYGPWKRFKQWLQQLFFQRKRPQQ